MPRHLLSTISWLFFSSFFAITPPTLCSNNNETDFLALLALKNAISSDPYGALTSWNETVPFCSWQGISCSQRPPNRVTAINLTSQGLVGPLSPHIGNLSFLTSITLKNNTFSGPIPDQIGLLTRLTQIEFSNNSFSGEIPRNLSQCREIFSLNLIDNNLIGSIIPELGLMLKLKYLGLGRNQLSGSIPPSIGNLTSLMLLSLENCGVIHGEIPDSLTQLRSLEVIILDENSLTGTVPLGLYNISTINIISMRANLLQGIIPHDIGLTLPNLTYLDLGNNYFNGEVPFSLSNCSLAEVIHLSSNNLTRLPDMDFTRLSALGYFVITNNPQMVGDLNFISSMANCTQLEALVLDGNSLSASLPDSISNLSKTLNHISLGENQLSGRIPSGIQNLIGLNRLNIQNNQLEGPIPFVMGNLNRLQVLYLGGNRLTGEIPFSLGNLTLLNNLYLGQNNLHGNIPQSLINCTNLLELDLSGNNLSGSVPTELMRLSSISITLNLSHNAFTDSIPLEVGSLINLVILDLSHNRFSGNVPSTLSSCLSLEQLYLDSNSLDGEIPDDLRTLRGLEYLDLSRNNLSGVIPSFLGEIDLKYLNLSYNRLEGQVPTLKVFQNESAVSLQGNNDLCGGISSLDFPSCSSSSNFPTVFKVLIPVLVIGAICIIVSVCLYVFMYKKREMRDTRSSRMSQEGEYLRLSYTDLMRSTSGFSAANLLGAGRFGSVYEGILDDGQTVVAVKVLNLNTKGASKSFVSECTVLGGIKHRNLVKIVSICSGSDSRGNDFKALVYEYMANGNLDEWLHSKLETRRLSLRQRLNIAIDVASALEYLHFRTNSVIVHGDLKPSNILLDHVMTARVGDFGLAKVVSDISATVHGSSSIAIKGTIGYIPPEYGMSGVVSREGDVYSFGIVLLEMFTGRRPTDDGFKSSWGLYDFVKSALLGQAMEVVDPIILDEYDNEMSNSIKGCIVAVMKIGVACSNQVPRERMLMTHVVKELRRVFDMAEIE